MKNIISIISLASVLTMASCSKDFIERVPFSTATVDLVYKTDKDYLDATIGAYSALRPVYNNMFLYGDVRGDDAKIDVTNKPSSTGSDLFTTNSSDGLITNTWSNYYVIIRRVNTILDNIADADPSVVKNKDRYIGEAKFIRALAYFDLVRIFGDVQMFTTAPTIDEAMKAIRTPAATIYSTVIIPDLIDAASKLTVTVPSAEVGRATKGAAIALLGKAYLYTKDFVKAESTFAQLMAPPYTYVLLTNWNDLWDYTKNEHHSEYIFDIEYETALGGQGSPFTSAFMPNVGKLLTYYGVVGFDEAMTVTPDFASAWAAGDKRKDKSIHVFGRNSEGQVVWVNPTTGEEVLVPANTSQSFTMKYLAAAGLSNDSPANWKVIRFADVVLMYAEALNENGKTGEALVQLNRIRTRAGLADASGGQDAVRDAIAQERRFELAFEGHRWFDLVRTGKALATMAGNGMKPGMEVFPVPLTQIQTINDPAIFKQNPGYD